MSFDLVAVYQSVSKLVTDSGLSRQLQCSRARPRRCGLSWFWDTCSRKSMTGSESRENPSTIFSTLLDGIGGNPREYRTDEILTLVRCEKTYRNSIGKDLMFATVIRVLRIFLYLCVKFLVEKFSSFGSWIPKAVINNVLISTVGSSFFSLHGSPKLDIRGDKASHPSDSGTLLFWIFVFCSNTETFECPNCLNIRLLTRAPSHSDDPFHQNRCQTNAMEKTGHTFSRQTTSLTHTNSRRTVSSN